MHFKNITAEPRSADLGLQQTDGGLESLKSNRQIFEFLFANHRKLVEKTRSVYDKVVEKRQHAFLPDRINLRTDNASTQSSVEQAF